MKVVIMDVVKFLQMLLIAVCGIWIAAFCFNFVAELGFDNIALLISMIIILFSFVWFLKKLFRDVPERENIDSFFSAFVAIFGIGIKYYIQFILAVILTVLVVKFSRDWMMIHGVLPMINQGIEEFAKSIR